MNNIRELQKFLIYCLKRFYEVCRAYAREAREVDEYVDVKRGCMKLHFGVFIYALIKFRN